MHQLRRILIVVAAACALPVASSARPQYAAKEGKPCSYCHVDPNGGGPRNPRGVYYGSHNHTFDGYDEEKVMGKPAEPAKSAALPSCISAWTVDLPAGSSRIAVADVAGDKTPRVIVLGTTAITVHNLSGDTPKVDATIELSSVSGETVKTFAVGQFAKGKPAMMAVPGALIFKDGDKYSVKKVADLNAISGSARFADGTETVWYFDGASQPSSWSVDLSAPNPLKSGNDMVPPADGEGVYRAVVARLGKDVLDQMQMPEEATKAGVIGLWDPRENNKLYGVALWTTADGTFLTVVPKDALGGGADVKPTWKSDKLAGKGLDLAFGTDPKGGKKTGIFVLLATGAEGKGRSLQFFSLQ